MSEVYNICSSVFALTLDALQSLGASFKYKCCVWMWYFTHQQQLSMTFGSLGCNKKFPRPVYFISWWNQV